MAEHVVMKYLDWSPVRLLVCLITSFPGALLGGYRGIASSPTGRVRSCSECRRASTYPDSRQEEEATSFSGRATPLFRNQSGEPRRSQTQANSYSRNQKYSRPCKVFGKQKFSSVVQDFFGRSGLLHCARSCHFSKGTKKVSGSIIPYFPTGATHFLEILKFSAFHWNIGFSHRKRSVRLLSERCVSSPRSQAPPHRQG